MKGLLFETFLLAVGFAVSVSGGVLENHAVYKIINKVDHGVLTINEDNTKVYLLTNEDLDTQKWRAKHSRMLKTYEFKPISNEDETLTAGLNSPKVRGMVTSSEAKYWQVVDVGGGDGFEILNYMTSECLTSHGLNSAVRTAPCDKSAQQQWKFRPL